MKEILETTEGKILALLTFIFTAIAFQPVMVALLS
tara:strand:- start:1840 stop:1944 length:105 start_codon:yes stop_codon:yes gene_type:complete